MINYNRFLESETKKMLEKISADTLTMISQIQI